MGRCTIRLLFVACTHLGSFAFISGVENWTFLQEGTSSPLSQDEELKCFTRMLDDLTCFWDDNEETNDTYTFYFSTEQRMQQQCHTTSYRVLQSTMRHVCAIPVEDIVLFQPLNIEVIESFSNVSKISQYVSIESVVLLDPPSNISVHLNGNPHELRIGWVPPRNPDINEFLIYEISYWKDKSSPASAKSVTVGIKQHHDLRDLKAGIRYMVRLRTKPDGISFDGFWSAWSDTASAVTPFSSDEINLRCSSPDLQFITCQWKVNKTEAGTQYRLYYQTRQVEWKICSNQRNTTAGDDITYHCTIATSEVNKTVVIINASYPHHIQTFYKKPFRTENIVRPDPPRIVKIDISTTGGNLRLFWEPPIKKLQNQMVYQIRYSEENGTGWKTLHIQKPLHSELLDLPHGKTYYMQLRAKPNGLIYRGYWSSWSDIFTATIPGSIGPMAVTLVVGAALLLAIALFVSHLLFPNIYSNMKKILWPQIPNLEKLLEAYLTDFQKYPQVRCLRNPPFTNLLMMSLSLRLWKSFPKELGMMARNTWKSKRTLARTVVPVNPPSPSCREGSLMVKLNDPTTAIRTIYFWICKTHRLFLRKTQVFTRRTKPVHLLTLSHNGALLTPTQRVLKDKSAGISSSLHCNQLMPPASSNISQHHWSATMRCSSSWPACISQCRLIIDQ
ncbi:thrombopoietin receptor isoform X2 [Amblyraja radiata]|uniref:thrombopoietin receptor isoform X2 n=1 Tax=Amblyraja radiata TaxID=386614 RepID=UPI001401DF2C|nr:thrombopoietin receptor isoform X2 [Amblyraja radiata]